MAALSRVAGDGRGRVVGEPELLAGPGGDDDALVVDGDDGVDGVTGVEVLDRRRGRRVGVVERDDDAPRRPCSRRAAARSSDAHHHLDAQRLGRGEEVGGPVRRRRQQQEDTGHGLMMARMSDVVEPCPDRHRRGP